MDIKAESEPNITKAENDMVVLDKNLKAPETPDPTWGVVKRKHKFSDFSLALKVSLSLFLSLAVAFIPQLSEIPVANNNLGELGLFFLFFTSIATLVTFSSACVKPKEEAHNLANARAMTWQRDVLQPYLEKKYGVKFYKGTNLFSWGWPSAEYNGRTIEVAVRGIQEDRDCTFSDMGHRIYIVSRDGIRLEEVVRPQTVSFKAMNPVY